MRIVPPDAELVARLRAGDEAAFALVLDDWSPGMLRLARSFVSTPDSAAEVVQDRLPDSAREALLAAFRQGRAEGR